MSDPASKDIKGLSPTIVGQIELICDRFELALRGEVKPRIEDYWREADGPDLLRELLVLAVPGTPLLIIRSSVWCPRNDQSLFSQSRERLCKGGLRRYNSRW